MTFNQGKSTHLKTWVQEKRETWETKVKKVPDSDFHRISYICVPCWTPAKQPYTVNYLKEETNRDLLSLALSEKKQLAGCVVANTQSSVFKAGQAKQEYDELLFLRSSLRKWSRIKLTKHGWTEFSTIWDNLKDKRKSKTLLSCKDYFTPYTYTFVLFCIFFLICNSQSLMVTTVLGEQRHYLVELLETGSTQNHRTDGKKLICSEKFQAKMIGNLHQ